MSLFSFWKKIAAQMLVSFFEKVAAQLLGAPSLPRFCFCGKGGIPQMLRAPSIRAFCEWVENHKSQQALFIGSIKARVPQVRGPHGQVFVRGVEVPRIWGPGIPQFWTSVVLALLLLAPLSAPAQPHFNGAKALEYARQFVAIGSRWPTSPGHLKAEAFLRAQFQHDQLEEDTFTASTPIGPVPMRNFIVRFPGKKDGVIVLATHYETNYWLKDINFVGANDGGSTTGLLMAIADQLRTQTASGKKRDGYSVWLLFDDGEESIKSAWTDSDSLYGTRHLAAKWARDGTLPKIKAFILADMIGDKDLDIQRETNSTDWLVALVRQAAKKFRYERYFFKDDMDIADDHLPFVKRGVPSIDIIDLKYGPNNSYHHTDKDTMDKISAHSLTIDGDVFMETIRLINLR